MLPTYELSSDTNSTYTLIVLMQLSKRWVPRQSLSSQDQEHCTVLLHSATATYNSSTPNTRPRADRNREASSSATSSTAQSARSPTPTLHPRNPSRASYTCLVSAIRSTLYAITSQRPTSPSTPPGASIYLQTHTTQSVSRRGSAANVHAHTSPHLETTMSRR